MVDKRFDGKDGKASKKGKRAAPDGISEKVKPQKKDKKRNRSGMNTKSEIREQDKIHKVKKKDTKKQKKKTKKDDVTGSLKSRSSTKVEKEKTDSEIPSAFLHGLSALQLLDKEDVRAMDATDRHKYFSQTSALCERLLKLMHSVLVSTDDRAANELPSFRDHVTHDLIRLRHVPLARRCTEMTLWHHVARFNTDCASRVKSLGYGASTPSDETAKGGLMNHDEDVKGEVFNSFKNRYMTNILDTFQEDLEKIRQNEGLDEEQVHFLRRCLDAGADLFAHIRAWDQNHPLGETGNSNTQNKGTERSRNCQ